MQNKVRILVLSCLILNLIFAVPFASAANAWAPGVSYKIGDQVTYNTSTYQCIQAHTSQVGWEPPIVPALWKLVTGSTATNTPVVPTTTPSKTSTRTNTPAGPTVTASRTSTRTNTPAGPTVTASGTATRTNTPVGPTATRTSTQVPPTNTATLGGGLTCAAPWNASAIYVNGNVASDIGHNYKANWWTQNERPSTSTSGVWTDQGVCTPPTPGPTAQPGSGLPARLFAVYADISFTPIQSAFQATGQKYYALAFILGYGGACVPAWDGTHQMSENYYSSQINAIRAGGGDVIAVFGGANGSDMASVCTTTSSLQAAFQAVINQYHFSMIDLNIEGGMVSDTASVDRRNKALKALETANPNLKVSITLPVLQSGLPQGELDVLSNAKSNGVRVDYVNVMAMNYGPSGVDMGQGAIQAATNTHTQLVGLGLTSLVGVTPMNGQNNTQGEIFTLANADALIAFAKANSYMGWLSFWSLGRDNGGCAGNTTASASCSGISQNAYDFTNKFKAFP
jgi:hypothetical protein